MKKLFTVLILFLLPLAPVRAQGLHGKILVVRDTSSYVPHDLESVLPTIYFGSIDSMFFLPADLSIYDAVLVKDDTLSVADKLSLIDYVKGKGKLYIESSSPPLDTLLQFLGLTGGFGDALVARYSEFLGVDSEFTKGLDVPHVEGDPTEDDLLESYIPEGNFIPVLYGRWVGNYIFAWVPVDTSIRAVVHYHPSFDYGHKAEYYVPFLTRVLCDYFGLCADAVHETPSQSEQAITMRVVYDGPRTDLQISGEEASEVDVSNALGVIVFRAPTQSGTSLVELPATLPDGFYFARVQSESGMKIQPFAIFAR